MRERLADAFNRIPDRVLTLGKETMTVVVHTVLIGVVLFAVSGVWPPLLAVESGSMEPNMQRGDLVFVEGIDRSVPEYAGPGKIVSESEGSVHKHSSFNRAGDVIVFVPNGDSDRKIIHRAMFWVTEGENWYSEANQSFIDARNCEALRNCPAPNSGYITKGDANERYDQAWDLTKPVKPEWVSSTAKYRIPYIGSVRLAKG